jgi:hypothetical protein
MLVSHCCSECRLTRSVVVRLFELPQIKECDDILAGMEGMLGKFTSDLGNISSEIRALQEQSTSMSVRLRNRRTVQVGARGGGKAHVCWAAWGACPGWAHLMLAYS